MNRRIFLLALAVSLVMGTIFFFTSCARFSIGDDLRGTTWVNERMGLIVVFGNEWPVRGTIRSMIGTRVVDEWEIVVGIDHGGYSHFALYEDFLEAGGFSGVPVLFTGRFRGPRGNELTLRLGNLNLENLFMASMGEVVLRWDDEIILVRAEEE